jgi:predicted dehydrogenase
MADRPLRLAVVGLGFGRAVHVPVFRSLPGVEVVAVAASRLAKAEETAAEHGIPRAVEGIDAVLDLPLDAVSLALPPAVGAVAIRSALARGLAVLTEKPLAPTLAEAGALVAAAGGRTATVDFTFGEVQAFRALRERITAGDCGRVRSVEVSWLTRSYADRAGRWSWKVDADRQGGVLSAQGSHLFHLLDWLFGPPVLERARLDRRATAAFAPPGARPAEDRADLWLRLPDGAPVTAVIANASPGGGEHRWDVVCDRGVLRVRNLGVGIMGGFALTWHGEDGGTEVLLPAPDAGGPDDRREPFRRLAARFADAARDGRPCDPDFAAGLRVQALMDRAFALDAMRPG